MQSPIINLPITNQVALRGEELPDAEKSRLESASSIPIH
jgi:hypothetical protein